MIELIRGLYHFGAPDFRASHRLFQAGPSSRRSGVLLILCNDLQIDPYRLIPTNFADLYVAQNVANIVSPADGSSSASSGVEQAKALYAPTDIVICGHAPCRYLDLALDARDEEMPRLAEFFPQVRRTYTIVEQHYGDLTDEDERRNVLARENVLVHLEHLRTLPAVAHDLDRGELHLHGWMYCDGKIHAYDVHQKQFVPLAQ